MKFSRINRLKLRTFMPLVLIFGTNGFYFGTDSLRSLRFDDLTLAPMIPCDSFRSPAVASDDFEFGQFGDGASVQFPADMLIVSHESFRPGPDEFGDRLDICAGLEDRGHEMMAQVIEPQSPGYAGPRQRIFPGGLDFADRPAMIMNDGPGVVDRSL